MKTKAAILEKINAPLVIKELTIPKLKPGQVLVDIAYSGICHNQLGEIQGKKGPDRYLPHTLGHEGSGVVLEVGEKVTKVKPGDHVVLCWIKGQGLDEPSTTYTCNGQNINSGAITTFLEKSVISENRLIPISKKMPLKEAALLGCAIPTGAGTVFNDMNIKPGNSLAIFGTGGIGSSALLAASFLKASPIIAVDVVDAKLEKAKQIGATHTINALKECPIKKIQEITLSKGVDFAFESAGKKAVMEQAFASVNVNRGLFVIAGNIPKGDKIHIDPFDLIQGKKMIGTWGGSTSVDTDIPKYVDLFLNHSFSLSSLITHEIRIEEINDFFKELQTGKAVRGIINLTR